jgi:uncharacterized protein (TIGR02594 family)
MPTVLDIQRALKVHGFDPGPLDGALGRLTLGALRAFQLSRQLPPDGMLGPRTAAALFGERAPANGFEPPWLAEARRHLGLRERAGSAHNRTILSWLAKLGASWRDDETPWCGTFVAHCIALTVPAEPLPANPFGARNWLRFGAPLTRAAPGALLVFHRGTPGGWQGHVGFHAGEDADAFHVLGGNQDNAVSIARIGRNRLLGMRWPRTAPLPRVMAPVALPGRGTLSTDEA